MSLKEAAPLSESRLKDLILNLQALYDELPADWVFAGVMLRSDFGLDEQFEGQTSNGSWVAIATQVGNLPLGPIPEARGRGHDMVSALVELRAALMEAFQTPE